MLLPKKKKKSPTHASRPGQGLRAAVFLYLLCKCSACATQRFAAVNSERWIVSKKTPRGGQVAPYGLGEARARKQQPSDEWVVSPGV